jgi:hypothetical protein
MGIGNKTMTVRQRLTAERIAADFSMAGSDEEITYPYLLVGFAS